MGRAVSKECNHKHRGTIYLYITGVATMDCETTIDCVGAESLLILNVIFSRDFVLMLFFQCFLL